MQNLHYSTQCRPVLQQSLPMYLFSSQKLKVQDTQGSNQRNQTESENTRDCLDSVLVKVMICVNMVTLKTAVNNIKREQRL